MKNYFERYGFIIVTIISSIVTFIKSYFFMDLLRKEELGYLSLFQSMTLMVNFFQMGVIYGGYRLISFSFLRRNKANNTVMTYLFTLFVFLLIIFCCINFFVPISWFWAAGLLTGFLSLWGNWISNMHIALGRINKLSIISIFSIIFSFLAFPLLYTYPLFGAVFLIGLQPFFLIVLSYFYNKDFGFKFDFKNKLYFNLILKIGFIPFLTGVLHYVNLQMERFVIGYDLGIKQLGEYYLVFMYVSLFSVIPNALGTLNFPMFMKSLDRKEFQNKMGLYNIFKIYYIEVLGYLVLAGIGTFFILPIFIKMILPLHVSGVKYVQIVFLGLAFFALIDPISFIMNAKLHYKELIYIYIYSLIVSIFSYSFIYFNKIGSLINYSYVNVIFYLSVSFGYVLYFIRRGSKYFFEIKNVNNL